MSVVGSFPTMSDFRTRAVRAPINPLDKSTVISIFPKDILETKPTIQPGIFSLKAGTYDNPSILVVGSSSWWKEIDEHQPILEIPVQSVQIADSIVNDYCRGLLMCDMGESIPGLFWVPGEHTVAEIKLKHQAKLDEANRKQRIWYGNLVKLADSLWARSNGNPLSIGDLERLAARELNLVNKDWLKNEQVSELVRCVACGFLKNPNFPVCSNCKNITDPVKAKELGLVFAQ